MDDPVLLDDRFERRELAAGRLDDGLEDGRPADQIGGLDDFDDRSGGASGPDVEAGGQADGHHHREREQQARHASI